MSYSPGASMGSSLGLYQPKGDLYQIIDSPAKPLLPTVPRFSPFKTDKPKFTQVIRSSQPLDTNTATFGMTSRWQSNLGQNAGAYGTAVNPGAGFGVGTGTGTGFGVGQMIGVGSINGLPVNRFGLLSSSMTHAPFIPTTGSNYK
jgi:hypothetical protein